jgi:ribosome-binding protein aMBF1 (putative translation factor)
MENTTKTEKKISRRDRSYYRQRQRNRVFSQLAKFFAEEAERTGITKKELAAALDKDPSQITRLLSGPTNLELDTISDYLLAMGAEMDHSIVKFADRAKPNFAHPTIAQCIGIRPTSSAQPATITGAGGKTALVRIITKPVETVVNPPTTTSG